MMAETQKICKEDALHCKEKCNRYLEPRFCDFAIVEGAKEEKITSLACMEPLLLSGLLSVNRRPPESQNHDNPSVKDFALHEKCFAPDEGRQTQIDMQKPKTEICSPPNETVCPPWYKDIPFKWDDVDTEIIKCVIDFCQRNEILRRVKRRINSKESTIRYKISRMVEHKILTKTPQNIAGYSCTTYVINPLFYKALIYDEDGNEKRKPALQFYKHANALKAKILDKNIPRPKGDKSYHPNNWKAPAQIFKYSNHTIRLMDNYAVVDINMRLEADSKEALREKYQKLAASYLHEFSKKYKYPLSEEIEEYRNPHTSIKGSKGIADAIVAKGEELYIPHLGIQIDHSHEDGEIEFVGEAGTRSAVILEQAINDFPKIAAGVISDNLQTRQELNYVKSEVSEKFSTLDSNLTQINQGIKDIQTFLSQEKQIHDLRAQNLELRTRLQKHENQPPMEKTKPSADVMIQ